MSFERIPLKEVPNYCVDMWAMYDDSVTKGKQKYQMYCLIDPRYNTVCYIGVTMQKFSKRLKQHRSPKYSNESAIAKLQRNLKTLDLTLQGHSIMSGDKSVVGKLEKYTIGYLRGKYGYKSLKNHQEGGFTHFGTSEESKKKMWRTKQERKHTYKCRAGEDNHTSKLTEKQVIAIYNLINKFYSNREIVEKLTLPIGLTGMNQIRNGSNWKGLYKKHSMVFIPSLNTFKGALTSQEKIDVLIRIEKGTETSVIKSLYNNRLQTTDIEKIKRYGKWRGKCMKIFINQ